MADVTIRATEPGDAAALCAMANLPGFRFNTGRMPYRSVADAEAYLAKLPPASLRLVAVVDGAVVGSAGLDRFTDRRDHAGLVHLGVHDDFVGRGVGKALMAALIDTADNWMGLRRLELTVYTDNDAGLALYRRFGFEVEGTLRSFARRDGAYVDAFTMARIVPPLA